MIPSASLLVHAPFPIRQLRRLWLPGWSLVFGLLAFAGCGKSPEQKTSTVDQAADGKAIQPIFEDVTKRAGLDFVHQLANGQLDNIMKSNGAGGTFLDYDNDGLMDVYLVNSGLCRVYPMHRPVHHACRTGFIAIGVTALSKT